MNVSFHFGGSPYVEKIDFAALGLLPCVPGLREARGEIVPGMENVWYEYVPESARGKKDLALVLHLHGGGNDGRRWAELTLWQTVADREGLILVYPDSPDYGSWRCDARDVQYLYDLIGLLCGKYPVDRSRIYMQGMSNGDMMTLAFTMAHPETLAAAGYMTGPTAPEFLGDERPAGALPVLQMRGELDIYWQVGRDTQDVYENRYSMNDLNRELWLAANGDPGSVPLLEIRGRDNFLYFEGEKAPVIQWEVQAMGHREPASGAQVLWDRLYSGARLSGGAHEIKGVRCPVKGDGTVLLATGSRFAYRDGQLIPFAKDDKGAARIFTADASRTGGLFQLNEMCDTEAFYAPVDVLGALFGAQVSYDETRDNAYAQLRDGRRVRFMNGMVMLEVDGAFRGISKPAILRCGTFFIPIGEVMRELYGCCVSEADDVIALSDHYALLGRYTARTMRAYLGGTPRPHARPPLKGQ